MTAPTARDRAQAALVEHIVRHPGQAVIAIVLDEPTAEADVLDPLRQVFTGPGELVIGRSGRTLYDVRVLGGRLLFVTPGHRRGGYSHLRGVSASAVWIDPGFVDHSGRLLDVLAPCMVARATEPVVLYGLLDQLATRGPQPPKPGAPVVGKPRRAGAVRT